MDSRLFFYAKVLLITAEIALISFLSYAVNHYMDAEVGRYISLEVFYCLPIIQTSRLAAIHAQRRSDTQISTIAAVIVALVWSVTEAVLIWPEFPVYAFVLNTFNRSVVLTVICRVVIKLWREREYARQDMLTGLSNRMEFIEQLENQQIRSERSRRPYSLLFIDIDQFKELNDIHGHRVGDEALKIVADFLRESSRQVDVVARFGGDEFVMLLPDTDTDSCDALIRRIERTADQAFQAKGWKISVSIGKTTNRGKSPDVDLVIHMADENMYQAKKLKRQNLTGAYA